MRVWLLVLTALAGSGCGTAQPTSIPQQSDGAGDAAAAETTASVQETAGADAAADAPDDAAADVATDAPDIADAADALDTATPDAAADTADAAAVEVADAKPDTTEVPADAVDAAADTAETASDAADAKADVAPAPYGELVIVDQVALKPFTALNVQVVGLPLNQAAPGKLRIFNETAGVKGTLAIEVPVQHGKTHENLAVTLKLAVVGEQAFVADLLLSGGQPALAADGAPLVAKFKVVGDTVDPELTIDSQSLPANDLASLKIAFVRVPDRFTVGLWLAIYSDVSGKPGIEIGKKKLLPGDYKDQVLVLTSALFKGQPLHGVLKHGAAGSGSWSAGNPAVKNFAGQVVEAGFAVDSPAFHPVLEIEDQTLTDPKKVLIKKVVIPQQYVGGWLALYADNAGKAGALLGKLYYITGSKENQLLSLTVAQQGETTLHAVLHAGQKWDEATNVVMKAQDGTEMKLIFTIGGKSLSYIKADPYTTKDPRHVMVTRAYSYTKPAWVVLARDDQGKPGLELARKKVLPKFAGNVHFDNLYGDFLEAGTIAEYLTGKPGTFRRYARGVEKLHVLLYEDFPSDNKFTYTPGGSEDVPVLDAAGKQVTALVAVTVKASVQNVQQDSPRYYYPCPLSQHVSNPTKLPVDCRCHVNIVGLDFPECKSDIADGLVMQFGDGPRARTHNFGGFHSGYVEPATSELVALLSWKDHKTIWPENLITIDVGAVMGIHYESRKRRVIGGRYEDPVTGIQTVGNGPVLSYPFEVQKGPDGKIYVASYAYVRIGASLVFTVDIIRMNPQTGDREFVWRSNHLGDNLDNKPNPYGHCANGRTEKFGYASVQIGRKAFGIDDKGNFYLSYAHNGNTPNSDGIGILQVSADGKACGFVTRTKVGIDNLLYKGQSVGTGFEPQAGPYKGMLIKGGKIYTSTELNDELVEVDMATGNRKLLHKDGVNDTNTGSSGTHVLWDAKRSLIWQGGLSGATLLFDPAKGTSEPLWCAANDRDYLGIACLKSAAWGNNGMPMERGMWMHPTDQDYMFVVNYSMIQRVDLKAGTSEIFSY